MCDFKRVYFKRVYCVLIYLVCTNYSDRASLCLGTTHVFIGHHIHDKHFDSTHTTSIHNIMKAY